MTPGASSVQAERPRPPSGGPAPIRARSPAGRPSGPPGPGSRRVWVLGAVVVAVLGSVVALELREGHSAMSGAAAVAGAIVVGGLVRTAALMARLREALMRAEEDRARLRASEERLRTTFRHSAVGQVMTDLQGRFVQVNPACCRMAGHGERRLLQMTWADLCHPDDLEAVRRALGPVVRAETDHARVEARWVRSDRTVIDVLIDVSPVRDRAGVPRHLVGLVQDVTNQKRAGDELRRSEARNTAILHGALDGIVTIDHAGRVVEFNPAAEAMFGYRRADAVGRRMADLIVPPESREAHRRGLARYLATGEGPILGRRLELEAMRADGSVFPAELTVTRVDVPGPPLFTGYIRDVTEARRAAEALREQKEILQAVFDHIPAMATLWSADGQLEMANRAWERTYGWTFEEARGGDLLAELYPDPEVRREVAAFIRAAEGRWQEFPTRVRDGRVIVVEWANVRLSDGRNIGVGHDVTERRLAQEQLSTRARQQAAVAELGRRALRGVDLPVLLQEAADLVARTLEVPFTEVLELLPDRRALVLRAGAGWDPGTLGAVVEEAGSQAGYTLRSGGPVLVPDVGRETRFTLAPPAAGLGVASAISVPIEDSGTPFGVLGAFSLTPRAFGEEDVHFMTAVSSVIGIAGQRKRAEEGLRETVERLRETDAQRRRLLDRLVGVQEEERRRIAADIHDDSVQAMTAVGLRLDMMRQRLEEAGEGEALGRLVATVTEATERLRRLIFELHPPSLDRFGLAAALREYTQQAEQRSGTRFVVRDRLDREPPGELRPLLYRVAREAIANVRKHARARTAEVTLETRDRGFLVRVRDDGAGFRVDEVLGAASPWHLGTGEMLERAQMAGGWCRIDSAPGAGTTVEVWVPEEPPVRPPGRPGEAVKGG